MHSQTPPICHRDLKSPNCLITQDPDTLQYLCKVSDFGLARKTGLQFVGSKVDNPVWLAPEVVRKEPYGLAADVYSFGVILWEMYVRKPFFDNLAFIYEIEDRVQAGQRPEIPSECPSDYASLIQDCWAQDPKSRPTFEQVLHRLHESITKRAEDTDFIKIANIATSIGEYHSTTNHRRSTYWYVFEECKSVGEQIILNFIDSSRHPYRQNRGVIGGECKATLPFADVTSMVTAGNGNLVMCAAKDGFVTLINPQARKMLRRVSLHTHQVTALVWIQKIEEESYLAPESGEMITIKEELWEGDANGVQGPTDRSPTPLSLSPPSFPPLNSNDPLSPSTTLQVPLPHTAASSTSNRNTFIAVTPSPHIKPVPHTTPRPVSTSSGVSSDPTSAAASSSSTLPENDSNGENMHRILTTKKSSSDLNISKTAAVNESSEKTTRAQPSTDTRSHPAFLRRTASRSLSDVSTNEETPDTSSSLIPDNAIRPRSSFIASSNFIASTPTALSPNPSPSLSAGPHPGFLSRSRSIQILNNNQRTSASASAATANSSVSPPSSSSSSSSSSFSPIVLPNSPPKNGVIENDPQHSTSPTSSSKPYSPTSLLTPANPFLSPTKSLKNFMTLGRANNTRPIKRSHSKTALAAKRGLRIRSNAYGNVPIYATLTRNRRHPSLLQQANSTTSNSLSFPLPPTKGILCSCSVGEGGVGGGMKVWEVDLEQKTNNVQLVTEIEGHAVWCFVMVGKYLWAGCATQNILVFDPSDWGVYTVVRVKEPVICLVFVESVQEVWAATSTRILSYNPQTKQSSIVNIGDQTTAMATVGNKVWSCGKDATIKVWDAQTKMCHYTIITGLASNITQMLVCGEFVWCACDSLVVYHSETYESVIELTQHKDKITQIVLVPSFLSSIPELWSASADGNIKMWTSVQMN